MRGSIYYQTAELTKCIFKEGAKKIDRINPKHKDYKCVASYKSMETYRSVWNNFLNYVKEHWRIKNCELITSEICSAYFEYKVEYYLKKQYATKIVSALMKLEFVLNKYSQEKYNNPIVYDFSEVKKYLKNSLASGYIADNYHSRTYSNAQLIIENLKSENHRLAVSIQLQGGARSEAVTLIKKEQLKGYAIDKVTNKTIGIIETKEKGGKVGDINITPQTYSELEKYFEINKVNSFRIKYQKYANDIKLACELSNEPCHGSHGFRWTFAQNRVREYQNYGYSYEQALQGTSWEMKHFRANITEHYLK